MSRPVGDLRRVASVAPSQGPSFTRVAAAETLSAACEALADELLESGFELPSVYLLVDGRLRCLAARGYYQVVDGFFPGVGVIGRCVQQGEAVIVPDVSADPAFVAADPGIRAEVCVPVRHRERVVGALNVESRSALPADAVPVLQQAADVLGQWLDDNGGLREVPVMQRLARICLALTSTTEVEEILPVAVQGVAALSGMGTGLIARENDDGTWARAAEGPLSARLRGWSDDALATMSSWVRAGTSSHFPGGEPPPEGYEFLARSDVLSLSVNPLVAGGKTFGLLVAAEDQPRSLEPNVGAALELLAAQTAAALRMAEAVQELRLQAVQDGLTGLPNAAAFAVDLQRAADESSDSEQAGMWLILLDLDFFKQTNDMYGHVAGDGLLRALAAALQAELRGKDKLYRIGGDEFAALITLQAEEDATEVAMRLLRAARDVRTTVSIGVSMVCGTDGTAVRSFADIALYRAKSAGRDCVRLAEDPG